MTFVSYLNTTTAIMLLVETMLFCRLLARIIRKRILHHIFGHLIVPLIVIKFARVANLACTVFGSEIGRLDSTFALRPSSWGHPGTNTEWLMQASDHIRGFEDDERGKGIYTVFCYKDHIFLLMSNLPSSSFQGTLTISASSVIVAPINKVWQILVDFTSYAEWYVQSQTFTHNEDILRLRPESMFRNTFVHKQRIVDRTSKGPLPDQTPREGTYLLMEVQIPPTSDRSHTPTSRPLEVITAVDPAAH
ncbi:predicted protein, partial [Postia placenta Mad-698-R]